MSRANEHRNAWFEGVQKCVLDETLYVIMDRIVRAEVHRLVVCDDARKVIGIISLSDILLYLVLRPAEQMHNSNSVSGSQHSLRSLQTTLGLDDSMDSITTSTTNNQRFDIDDNVFDERSEDCLSDPDIDESNRTEIFDNNEKKIIEKKNSNLNDIDGETDNSSINLNIENDANANDTNTLTANDEDDDE